MKANQSKRPKRVRQPVVNPVSAGLAAGTACRSLRNDCEVIVVQEFGPVLVGKDKATAYIRDGYIAMDSKTGEHFFYTAGDLIAHSSPRNYSHIVRVK